MTLAIRCEMARKGCDQIKGSKPFAMSPIVKPNPRGFFVKFHSYLFELSSRRKICRSA